MRASGSVSFLVEPFMKPTKSIYIGTASIAIAVILALFFLFLRGSSTSQSSNDSEGELPAFTPPVYGPPESDFFIDRPLHLTGVSGGGLTAAQRQRIGEYRKKILARVVSNVPLRDDEKRFIASSIATTTVPSFLEGVVFLNQTMFQFAPDEIGLISAALGR